MRSGSPGSMKAQHWMLWMTCFIACGSPHSIEAAGCETPLEEETLPYLDIWMPRSAQPGSELYFLFGRVNCCYLMFHATDCVTFSVAPAGAAEIEPPAPGQTPEEEAVYGKLKLGSLQHGDTVTLRADIENGRKIVEATVHIYTPEQNPLVGFWQEVSQIECAGFKRGDTDGDGQLVITDAVATLGVLFLGDPEPDCLEAADANADGTIDISDPVHILSYLFGTGFPPPYPFPDCGEVFHLRLGCDTPACGGNEVVPVRAIQELLFEADGTFSVTWTPFELYRDYWGKYEYELETGGLSLQVEGGNYTPRLLFGRGPSFRIEAGRFLVLENLSLGPPPHELPTLRCGHRFR